MPFDIKTATALVQPYDGSADGLEAFIDAKNLLAEIIDANQIPTTVKFLKTRLTGKARFELSTNTNTIEALIQDVKQRCISKTTPENLTAKLKTVKLQGSVENFCDEVDLLTSKLKSAYIQQKVPEETANSMATKVGIDTLINGSNSQETKIILKAGAFSDIKNAIQKVLENSSANQPVHILSYPTPKAIIHVVHDDIQDSALIAEMITSKISTQGTSVNITGTKTQNFSHSFSHN